MCRMEQARAGAGTVPELQWAAQHRRVQPSTPAPLLQGPCFRSPSSPHLAAVWGPPRLRGPERMTLLGAPTGGGEGECHLGWHFAHHPCTHLTLTSHHLPHSGGVVRGGTRATGFHRGPRALSSPTPCLPFCRGLLGQPSGRSSSRRTAGCTFGERFPGFHGFSPDPLTSLLELADGSDSPAVSAGQLLGHFPGVRRWWGWAPAPVCRDG